MRRHVADRRWVRHEQVDAKPVPASRYRQSLCFKLVPTTCAELVPYPVCCCLDSGNTLATMAWDLSWALTQLALGLASAVSRAIITSSVSERLIAVNDMY